MTMYKSLLKQVDDGRKGKNKGIPMGFPRIENYIYGLQKHRYDVIFGESGTGKSSFAWHSYILNPYDYLLKNPDDKRTLKIFLFSLEVTAEQVIAKMICWKLYQSLGILVDVNFVLSRGKATISPEVYELVVNYENYFNILLETTLTIFDRPMKPTDIKTIVDTYAKSNGKFYKNAKGEHYYVPNNPNELVIVITDTVGNLELEPNGGKTSTKGTIDLHSSYCRDYYRNLYNYLAVDISHANRSTSDPSRARTGELFHQLSDIKETNMLAQNANLVMCLFDAERYSLISPKMNTFMNYNVKSLRQRMRVLGVLKNRSGTNNKRVGLGYLGECGWFQELPRSNSMGQLDYDFYKNKHSIAYLKREEAAAVIKTALQKKKNSMLK